MCTRSELPLFSSRCSDANVRDPDARNPRQNHTILFQTELSGKNYVVSRQGTDFSQADSLLEIYCHLRSRRAIAGFDLDDTLLTSKKKGSASGSRPEDKFQLFHPSLPAKLAELYARGFDIVIFTNQLGLSTGRLKLDTFFSRVQYLLQQLSMPVRILCAPGDIARPDEAHTIPCPFVTADNRYRKPGVGMWSYLEALTHPISLTPAIDPPEGEFASVRVRPQALGSAIDTDQSFFVGDAAGRHTDFADSDVAFARQAGLAFYTPEVYFSTPTPSLTTCTNASGTTTNINSSISSSSSSSSCGSVFQASLDGRVTETTPADLPAFGKPFTDILDPVAEDVVKFVEAKANASPEMVLFVGSPASGPQSFGANLQ
jgi:DNA 3'-phosphatase